MTFAVIRVRGSLKVKPDIKETLRLLRLNQVNHCVVIPESEEYKGMLQKAKDYITWGEIDQETLGKMMNERGRIVGDNPLTAEFIKANTSFKTIDEVSDSIVKGEMNYKDIDGIKPIFRLAPPVKGGYEGIKRSFRNGGALGYRGEKINDLISRMI
jgi:large subunit ribosomal protein L30